jgi:RNA polymerase sigma factor (sigma-70 family)
MFVEPEMARYYLSILKEGKASSNVVYREKKFKEFHRALYKDLTRRICSRYRCDDYVADDVLGEVFIKIFSTAHYPENPATFFAWVSIICKNEFVNFCRKNKNSAFLSIEVKKEQNIYEDDVVQDNQLLEESAEVKVGESLHELGNDGLDPDIGSETLGSESCSVDRIKDNEKPQKEYSAIPKNVHTEELSDEVYDEAKKNDLIKCVQNALRILRSKSLDKALAIEWQMEGLSSKEMAELLKRSDDATRRLLSDAKKMLKDLSAPCYEMIR